MVLWYDKEFYLTAYSTVEMNTNAINRQEFNCFQYRYQTFYPASLNPAWPENHLFFKLAHQYSFSESLLHSGDASVGQTHVMQDESAPSRFKDSKERLSVLGCSNAGGTHKSELLVIGESASLDF